MRIRRTIVPAFLAVLLVALCSSRSHAQAALLMEEPYGFFGELNPTEHIALYFEHVCAETPIRLRRCAPGEPGSVIARYEGIAGYDWVAMPLVPYFYSMERARDVPDRVDHKTVVQMRERYREVHLLSLGVRVPTGGFTRGGWTQLVGTAYERRTYAFRFETTPEQDDAFIERMNSGENRSHFELFYNNCADFARGVLNTYFPGVFRRSILPDLYITTPKQIAYKLVRYGRKHPALRLTVLEIPQIPGYRHLSHSNKSVAESLSTTAYMLPIVLVNPYLAGGLFADYVTRGRFHPIPRYPVVLAPDNLTPLTDSARSGQNAECTNNHALSVTDQDPSTEPTSTACNFNSTEMKGTHE
jgi:hypothetical protein